MKQFLKISCSTLVAACLFSLTAVNWVAADVPKAPMEEVREKIIQLIEEPTWEDQSIDEMTSTLHFTINSRDELVVLTVETDYPFVDRFLKKRLNYQKVTSANVRGRYAMKITLKNGSSR